MNALLAPLAPYAQTIKAVFVLVFLAFVFYGGWKLKDYQVANKENKEFGTSAFHKHTKTLDNLLSRFFF